MKKLWFKRISSVHGRGLFASQYIKKGSQIIEYVGDKVTKKEGDRRADKQINKAKKNINNGMVYVFELNKHYDIDGDVSHNHARLINHSCNPNCEVVIDNNHLWISALKNIKKIMNYHIIMVIPTILIMMSINANVDHQDVWDTFLMKTIGQS